MRTEHCIAGLMCVLALTAFTVTAEEKQPPAEKKEKDILFIGNSFTRFNEMPTIISKLAATNGKAFKPHREAPNGETLLGHSKRDETIGRLKAQNWDCIVMQDLSLGPILHRHNMMLGGAALAATAGNTKLYVFQTWAYAKEYRFMRISGVERYRSLRDDYKEKYRNMQQLINEGYTELAKAIDAEVVPVGSVWEAMLKKHPDVVLHAGDHYHPNKTGSYLTALVFYKTFFGERPKRAVTELVDQATHDKMIAVIDAD